MNSFEDLTEFQQNILIASILGDGEITKIYKNSRRKNNSYREHFSIAQLPYRTWKQSKLDPLIYFSKNKITLRSKSTPLFTNMYDDFYDTNRGKRIPEKYLSKCTHLVFLFVLYLDDGSLSITKSINHRLKRIYLTPHIFLYLQSFNQEDLILLQQHINQHFQLNFSISKRKDGFGYILRFTSTSNTYKFLDKLSKYASEIPEMYYKTNWSFRLAKETKLLKQSYPGYKVIASSSHRNKAYSYEEIQKLIELKKLGVTDKQISITLNRTYWSVVYKLRELRKQNLL